MKRNILICILMLAVSLCFGDDFAKAVNIHGKVQYLCNGVWEDIKKGDQFPAGTTIQTGFNSYADFKVDKSVFTVEALTRICIDDLTDTGTKQTVALHLDAGKLNNNVKAKNGKALEYRVKTVAVTASVRGTKFSITSAGEVEELDKSGDHTVYILNHKTGIETAIRPGEHYEVKPDGERRDEKERTEKIDSIDVQERNNKQQSMTGISISVQREE